MKYSVSKLIRFIAVMAVAIAVICFMAACTQPVCTSERADQNDGENCGVLGPVDVLCGHELYDGDNVLPHDSIGYCGNIVTTVKYDPIGKADECWEKSFWGSHSVALTDMLRWLDYSDDICRCKPEYTVTTEGGDVYGVNLAEGYVRYGKGQVQLTESQMTELKATIEAVKLLPVELSYTPLAE